MLSEMLSTLQRPNAIMSQNRQIIKVEEQRNVAVRQEASPMKKNEGATKKRTRSDNHDEKKGRYSKIMRLTFSKSNQPTRKEEAMTKKPECAVTNAPPVFPSASTTTTRKESSVPAAPTFESLPQELFCQVLSFLGPKTSSLTCLAQVSRKCNRTMQIVGDSMLRRVRSHFRVPLSPLAQKESSTSLFVRHARACADVFDRLLQLKSILDKDFPMPTASASTMTSTITTSSNKKKEGEKECTTKTRPTQSINLPDSSASIVTEEEIDTAIELALDLLGAGSSTTSLSAGMKGCSASLEWRLLALCGKCGGKVFKYAKAHLQSLVRMPGGESDNKNFSTVLTTGNSDTNKFQEQLDKARLAMQLVIFHDLQMSRKQSTDGKANSMLMRRVSSSAVLRKYSSNAGLLKQQDRNSREGKNVVSFPLPAFLQLACSSKQQEQQYLDNRTTGYYGSNGMISPTFLLTTQLKGATVDRTTNRSASSTLAPAAH